MPQFYLRRFADANDQVSVVSRDLKKRFTTSVAKAAAETDFYAVETTTGEKSQEIEKFLSVIETHAARALEGMLSGQFPPSDEDRETLALFIAFQVTRGRAHRQIWATITDAGVKMSALMLASGETSDIAARLAAKTGEPATADDVAAVKRLVEDPESWEAVAHQNSAIENMLKAAPQYAPYISARRWRLARFTEPLLLTSDSPVAMWHRTDTRSYGIGLANADELRLPLGPRHALVMTAETGREHTWDLLPHHANDFNRAVAARGYEWIYHTPGRDPLASVRLPPPRPPVEVVGPPMARDLSTR